ncbi:MULTISPECIES: hypothetical protein [Vibrio]|uniref:hypothetical protein n=1 Tax=Vibrio TaxID=662 RepID=UPI00046F7A29|nr:MULTISPECIES: hypothetical protein [Vibrio]EGR0791347.1 hypothetical protein [Vibrio vulnificus]EGR0829352.1 hypothetical protein [Vibrio vulnificus]EGR0849865.1 hypothetical protein [Vibrio vulnificus]EGR0854394.1 hypothetical protein [Vibrio vulnificus]EGR0858938.1 hypothetical protein [Vibrio vulnificus]
MPTIYALKGRHNSGKTTTLRLLETTLLTKYPLNSTVFRTGVVDITVVMDINGQRIGIACGGDSETIVLKNLKTLTSYNCDIIFCATRSRGKTVTAVNSYSATHTVHFERKQHGLNNDAAIVSRLLTLSGL